MSDNDSDAVLGGILPDRREHLTKAVVNLEPERHFTDATALFIFKVLRRYFDRTNAVIPAEVFNDIINRQPDYDATRKLVLIREFGRLCELEVPDDRFVWAMDSLRDRAAERDTGSALVEAMSILETGWVDPSDRSGKMQRGADAARAHLVGRIHAIERSTTQEFAPEGDMRFEQKEALEQYAKRQAMSEAGIIPGVKSGIECIDNTTGGINAGEFGLIVSYSNQGKTHLVTQWAWHAAFVQGVDAFFATTETIRDTVKRRIASRHSRLPQFGKPEGINAKDIKQGTLSKQDLDIYMAVLEDMATNPNYGRINIIQLPSDASLSYVDVRLKDFTREAKCELCVIDYLPLLKPEVVKGNEREEFNQRLRDVKGMARSLNNGEGMAILSPWQVKQQAYKDALSMGAFSMAALADTSEAEKTPDLIWGLLKEPDNYTEALIQHMKVRDDEFPPIREVGIDYRSSYLNDKPKVGLSGLAPNQGISELLSSL